MRTLWMAALAGLSQEDAPRLDSLFFEARVQPILRGTCASGGCHGNPSGAGNLKYQQAGFSGDFTEEQTRENLRASIAFVRAGKPEESLLYLKALRESDGGLPHGGRSYAIAKDSEEAAAIVAWIEGERLAGVPPVAEASAPASAPPGTRVRLDGSRSRDGRGAPLTFRWAIVSAPPGSRPKLDGADQPRAWLVPDLEGTYGICLTVGNGEAEATSALALSVERLPYVHLEAEESEIDPPFEAVPDASASAGAFLSAEGIGGRGKAVLRFDLGEDGEYELWVRARTAASGASLSFRIEPGAALRWRPPPSEGWVFAPIAASGPSRRTPVSGSWDQRDGALVGTGRRGEPALIFFDVKASEGTLEARVAPPGGGFAIVGSRDRRAGMFAGLASSGKFAIGSLVRGGPQILAESEGPAPGSAVSFKVGFERGRIRLLSGEKVVLEREFPAAPGAGAMRGRRATPPALDVGLLVPVGSAWFDDVKIHRRGEIVLEERFEGATEGLRLGRGEHRLEVEIEEGEAALDEILLVKAGASAALSPADRRFARGAYLDLLGRSPSDVELLAFGADRAALPARLAGSLEFWQAWYEEELYYFLLIDNFRPATPSLTGLPARLANGSIGVDGAVREIVISQNFAARNPGPDTFVTVVLEQLLGMKVQDRKEILEAGKRMYDGYPARLFGKEGRSQSDFVEIVTAEEGFAPFYLGRFHRSIFGAEPPEEDPAIESFRRDPRSFPVILRDWIGSPRYASALEAPRAKTDPMFVRSLFVDLLGRPPSYREFRNMRNALQALSDPGPIRSVMARVLVDSGKSPLPLKDSVADPEAWIESRFLQFLARKPTDGEKASFRKEWDDAACTPASVVTALVTSREYQTY